MTATDDYNTEQVKKLLKDDRTITYEEMVAQELEISVGSVHFILRNRLKMHKVSARSLSHRLMPEQAECRLTIATQLLYRYDSEGQDFLVRIVAVNKTWIRSYEPEIRRQSTEWHTPSSPRPAKYRRTHSKLKMLMIFAYDRRGILTSQRVESGKTINRKYYEECLKKHLGKRYVGKDVDSWQLVQLFYMITLHPMAPSMQRLCQGTMSGKYWNTPLIPRI